jgi:hypothetical protein
LIFSIERYKNILQIKPQRRAHVMFAAETVLPCKRRHTLQNTVTRTPLYSQQMVARHFKQSANSGANSTQAHQVNPTNILSDCFARFEFSGLTGHKMIYACQPGGNPTLFASDAVPEAHDIVFVDGVNRTYNGTYFVLTVGNGVSQWVLQEQKSSKYRPSLYPRSPIVSGTFTITTGPLDVTVVRDQSNSTNITCIKANVNGSIASLKSSFAGNSCKLGDLVNVSPSSNGTLCGNYVVTSVGDSDSRWCLELVPK